MFYDMAILVEEQGEMIDLIEHNVELAAAHVEVGQQNIRRAAEYSRSNRRVSHPPSTPPPRVPLRDLDSVLLWQ